MRVALCLEMMISFSGLRVHFLGLFLMVAMAPSVKSNMIREGAEPCRLVSHVLW